MAAVDGGFEGRRLLARNRVEPDEGCASRRSVLEENGAVGREADGIAVGGNGGDQRAGLEVDHGERGLLRQVEAEEASRRVERQAVAKIEGEPRALLVGRVKIQLEAPD